MLSLGFNLGHDQGAALVEDGRILYAISQERIDRIKHSSGVELPLPAINYCLEAAGKTWADIDSVVYNYPHHHKAYGNIEKVEREIEKLWGKKPIFIPHHLSHAYAAFYASGFEEATVLVADGAGNRIEGPYEEFYAANGWPVDGSGDEIEAESVFHFSPEGVKPVFSRFQTRSGDNQRLSLGRMYWETCLHIGMGRLDAGKLMGLAPYGRHSEVSEWIDTSRPDFTIPESLIRNLPCGDFDRNAQAAYAIQRNLEEMLLSITHHSYELSPTPKLCMAGGIALNAITNRRIIDETEYEELYVVPPCNDTGIPLGCAYYGYFHQLGGTTRAAYTQYTGRSYTDEEMRAAIGNLPHKKCDDIAQEVAGLLVDAHIVGWFQGGSEYGPRALGNRSILSNPTKEEYKDRLNNRVKHREPFRPFAPSVLFEDARTYFELPCDDSPYMLLILKVLEDQRKNLGAVTHVDGTARIQTVRKEENPQYHRLISLFGEATGVNVVLNTSFNVAGEPVVETPSDAIRCFMGTDIDYLAVGDYLIWKEAPAS